jgi:putative flippase GtrA
VPLALPVASDGQSHWFPSPTMRFSQQGHISTGQADQVPLTCAHRNCVEASCECHSPTEGHRVVIRQMVRFTGIGIVMTLAYLALYAAMRGTLGMQGANVVAWVATAVVDTSANRRLTFGVSGLTGAARAQAESLLVFGTGMIITSAALLTLGAVVANPGEAPQLAVLVGANAVSALLRFMLLRHWVFGPRRLARRARSSPGAGEEGRWFRSAGVLLRGVTTGGGASMSTGMPTRAQEAAADASPLMPHSTCIPGGSCNGVTI